MTRLPWALLALVAVHSSPAVAADAAPAAPFVPNVKPTLVVSRATGPISIDGSLDDAGWNGAAVADNFAEFTPGDRTQPSVQTKVLMTYDESRLYVAFIADDPDPTRIRATLRDRDEAWSDDWVALFLDTYGEASWVYDVYVNPLGVQMDARWTQRKGDDVSFDMLFHSKGRITESGYQVEIAIPFSSLRFPNRPEQAWRATFFRNHPRETARSYSWAAMEQGTCYPCNYGTLLGIRDVQPGAALKLLPALTGSQSGALANRTDPASLFSNQPLRAQGSVSVRYDFTSSVAAEATLNPDFSQVESDAPQIDVNTTLALSYPERRPFFLEGSELFQTPLAAVYTRSINDPIVAAKTTGHVGRFSFGHVVARDEHTPALIPLEERSVLVDAGRSTSNILRLHRNLSRGNFVGALVTDRRMEGRGGGTLVGADGTFRFRKSYLVRGQLLASHTREPRRPELTARHVGTTFDAGRHTLAFDGESYWGHGGHLTFRRNARRWNFNVDHTVLSPTFRAENGFINSNDSRQLAAATDLTLYPRTGLVDSIKPALRANRTWNFQGVRKLQAAGGGLTVVLKSQTSLSLSYARNSERFGGVSFDGFGTWQFRGSSQFSKYLAPSVDVTWGPAIARTLATPLLGDGFSFVARATVRPTQRLVMEPDWSYSRLVRPTGETIFSGHVVRTRLKYQMSRPLSARLIVQYDEFRRQIDLDPLVGYKLNPFTIVYAGSTRDYTRFDPPFGWIGSSRQYFFKLQYLFQR